MTRTSHHLALWESAKMSMNQVMCETVIYQDKSTVSQKTCHAAKRFQRMGFLSKCGVTTFSCIETFIAHLSCAFFQG